MKKLLSLTLFLLFTSNTKAEYASDNLKLPDIYYRIMIYNFANETVTVTQKSKESKKTDVDPNSRRLIHIPDIEDDNSTLEIAQASGWYKKKYLRPITYKKLFDQYKGNNNENLSVEDGLRKIPEKNYIMYILSLKLLKNEKNKPMIELMSPTEHQEEQLKRQSEFRHLI